MPTTDLESFVALWSIGDGGQERANYALARRRTERR
jgi:hypothetical protein